MNKKMTRPNVSTCLLFVALFFVLSFFMPALPSLADGEENGFVYSTLAYNSYIKGYTGESTDVVIPETLGGYPVRGISTRAFANRSSITSITLPESLHGIGEYAFSGCSSLTNITIPQSVVIIQDYAFYECTQLETLIFKPDSCEFGKKAFSGCAALKEVHITDVNDWLLNSFEDVSSNPLYYTKTLYVNGEPLTELTVDESVTVIPAYAFDYCKTLKSVTLHDGVTTIGSYAFSSCDSLQTVHFGSGLQSLGYYSFSNCKSLQSIEIPEGVSLLPMGVFSSCSYLRQVSLPDSLTVIGEEAFSNCTSLENITIPKNVTEIDTRAFKNCRVLTTISIPPSLTTSGYEAFLNCHGLRGVYITDLDKWVAIDFDELLNNSENPLMYAHNLYLNGELLTDAVLSEGVTEINTYAFYGCTSLKSIEIPASVDTISSHAFNGCTSLKSVTFRGEYPFISYVAFTGCRFTGYYPVDLWDSVSLSNKAYGALSIEWLSYCFEHDWKTDYTIDKKVTCEIDGSKSIHCNKCDSTKDTVRIPSSGHMWKTTYTVDIVPTCTKAGSKSIHCMLCSATQNNTPIAATPHPWEESYTIDTIPTCTQYGSKSIHCSVCDTTTDFTAIPRLPHNWSAEFTVDREPSCAQSGFKSNHCLDCSAITNNTTIDKLPHTLGPWKTRTLPTYTSAGEEYRVCNICQGEETQVLEPVQRKAPLGNVDGDSAITTTDARLILQYAVGKINANALDLTVADVDGDQSITTTDARLVLQYAVQKISEFPVTSATTYALRETWVVEDQWAFRVDSVEVHELCNSVANQMSGYTHETVVIINYHYTNLGYTGPLQDLYISCISFVVLDEKGQPASIYACTHVDAPQVCGVGESCAAQEDYVLKNSSSELVLTVSFYASNGTGLQEATFILPISPAT